MLLRDVMTKGVAEVSPEATLSEAAEKMRTLDVGALPVCDTAGRILGMVTDRDIVVRAIAENADPRRTKVARVMTQGAIYCFADDDLTDAAKLMEQKQVRRLIVMDHDGHPVGIVSLGDLARTHQEKLTGEILERVVEPSPAPYLQV